MGGPTPSSASPERLDNASWLHDVPLEQRSFNSLSDSGRFVERHIGPSAQQTASMLAALGLESLDELIEHAVPASIRSDEPLALPEPVSEVGALAELEALAGTNQVMDSLLGMGYYATITPAVIQRNVLENPAWYTAYTPYQPEISQGRLEALLNFQTMVAELCGLDLASASLLDEGTAAAEAMALAHRSSANKGNVFWIDADTHPQTIACVRTRAEPIGVEVVLGGVGDDLPSSGVFGALFSYPGSSGQVRDLRAAIAAVKAAGAVACVASDLLALALLTPPGTLGADVVVGSAQRFGVPLGYGGPHAGFMAVRDGLKRTLPGRLVGVSIDAGGRRALRLALQTREQHIRREKATSNICTAQVLLAVMASMYAVYHGPDGLRRIASRVHRCAAIAARGLRDAGLDVVTDVFFDTITVRKPGDARRIVERAGQGGLLLRLVDDDHVGMSFDETSTRTTVEQVWESFQVVADFGALDSDIRLAVLPASFRRDDDFLAHDAFHRYHSETEMLRYLRMLADKDVALDRSMIPLGSCTMKLNATTEMIPVTWPEFGQIHPFAPLEQARGYQTLIRQLEDWLVEITGYDKVSLQPNAGSQGEYAGLLAIRAYHRSRGDDGRDVCLIPSSAHGTNAASAAMAAMKVVVVACDDDGNVDIEDLKAKLDKHADHVGALMVTYPSTHGVFEEQITTICDLVHAYGGQVYLDGANMNALVGVARPGRFGADVSHLNLHKTFCIPHGGGGPGVGPVCVRAHLAPFLPNHPVVREAGPASGIGPIAAAPWGSASILPISWAYIRMMGADGLRSATAHAILGANYIAHRLAPHYPVLYTGPKGYVAHECIIDLRPITKTTGVSVDDVAKRLIDYGFHAPTMSFPVAGTLMIEPTESEGRRELDRFCDAMIAIRQEIARIERGEWPRDDNALANAPHTAADLTAGEWLHPYSREEAAYPAGANRDAKYWPPVSRIDNAYGDRNVVCACPPLSDYE